VKREERRRVKRGTMTEERDVVAKKREKEEGARGGEKKRWIVGWMEGLFDPVDNSVLVLYRILWGLVMMYEFYTFTADDYSKAKMYFLLPKFLFKYQHFEWVQVLQEDHFKIYLWSMMIVCLCVALGFLYRLASTLLFFGFWYLTLLDSALYLNHFYLATVIAFLMIFFPAHHDVSIDCLIFPEIRSKSMSVSPPLFLLFSQSAGDGVMNYG